MKHSVVFVSFSVHCFVCLGVSGRGFLLARPDNNLFLILADVECFPSLSIAERIKVRKKKTNMDKIHNEKVCEGNAFSIPGDWKGGGLAMSWRLPAGKPKSLARSFLKKKAGREGEKREKETFSIYISQYSYLQFKQAYFFGTGVWISSSLVQPLWFFPISVSPFPGVLGDVSGRDPVDSVKERRVCILVRGMWPLVLTVLLRFAGELFTSSSASFFFRWWKGVSTFTGKWCAGEFGLHGDGSTSGENVIWFSFSSCAGSSSTKDL